MQIWRVSLVGIIASLASSAALAQGDGCRPLTVAFHQSSNYKVKFLGHSGTPAQPAVGAIVSSADYSMVCKFLRDESLDGEPAAVYQRIYASKIGKAEEVSWISKKSGRFIRTDLDVDMVGKGKGHDSRQFVYSK